jgi:negative regulator of flagellin synthesis FlgM
MPDREDMIAEIKAKIEAGDYQPSSDEIADAMIRRSIADHIR